MQKDMKIWFIVCGWYYDRIDEFYAPLKELETNNESVNVFWSCHKEPTDYIKENFNHKYFPKIGLSDTKYQQALDVLDIEVLQSKIAGFQQVGAVMTTSETGTVVHPETDEEDMKTISNLLGGNIEAATINGGIPFVSSAILANNNSVVVGSLTNGPEIMMLTRAFLH